MKLEKGMVVNCEGERKYLVLGRTGHKGVDYFPVRVLNGQSRKDRGSQRIIFDDTGNEFDPDYDVFAEGEQDVLGFVNDPELEHILWTILEEQGRVIL